jgi:hypothetical protein
LDSSLAQKLQIRMGIRSGRRVTRNGRLHRSFCDLKKGRSIYLPVGERETWSGDDNAAVPPVQRVLDLHKAPAPIIPRMKSAGDPHTRFDPISNACFTRVSGKLGVSFGVFILVCRNRGSPHEIHGNYSAMGDHPLPQMKSPAFLVTFHIHPSRQF